MTEYVIRLISKITGNETLKRLKSKDKKSAMNKLLSKYDKVHVTVFTKSEFMRQLWNRGDSGLITYAHYELVWKTAPNNEISEDSWKKYMNNIGKIFHRG